MPIPFAQADVQSDLADSQGLTPAATTSVTYQARMGETFANSFGAEFINSSNALRDEQNSNIISQEDANNQYGNGGLTKFDGPVTEAYAKYKSGLDADEARRQDTLARGGDSSAAKTWLGFGASTAVGLLDPISDGVATATGGITKLAPIASLLGELSVPTRIAGLSRPGTNALISGIPSRLAEGAVQGAAFSAATEPLHAALDDQPWTPEDALQRLGSAALFVGITHSLLGKTPLKLYTPDEDIASPAQATVYDQLEDHLAPETKQAMGLAAISRDQAGKSFDPINDILGLDPRIIEHEAKLGGAVLPVDERLAVLKSMDDGTYKPPALQSDFVVPAGKDPSTVPGTPLISPDWLVARRLETLRQLMSGEQSTLPPTLPLGRSSDMPPQDLTKQADELSSNNTQEVANETQDSTVDQHPYASELTQQSTADRNSIESGNEREANNVLQPTTPDGEPEHNSLGKYENPNKEKAKQFLDNYVGSYPDLLQGYARHFAQPIHDSLVSRSPSEISSLLKIQREPLPIKGESVAKLARANPHVVMDFDHDHDDPRWHEAAKIFVEKYLKAQVLDNNLLHKDEAPEITSAVLDFFGEAKKHYDLTPHEEELAAQSIHSIFDKLKEAKASSELPRSMGLTELGIHGEIQPEDLLKLDKEFGYNNWILKPHDPSESQQGAGIFFPEALRRALNGHEAIYNRGYNAKDLADIKITKDQVQKFINPEYYHAQERIHVASETQELREKGHSILPGEHRVHVWTSKNGEVHIIPYATVDKASNDNDGTILGYDTPQSLAAEEAVKKAIEALPLKDRSGSTFGPDSVTGVHGVHKAVELNPTIESGLVQDAKGEDITGSSGKADNPIVQSAFLSAFRGELPVHAELARELMNILKEGEDHQGLQPTERINKSEDEKQAGYQQAINCVTQ